MVVSISKSSHRCLYMEVEVIIFIFTPLTCLGPGRKRELMFWRGSGNSRALCLAGINNSPGWHQTRCCGRALAGTLGTGCYWSCSPVLLHHLLLFSFSLMEKQTSVAIAGMQHFESARERWATSVLHLPKSLKKLWYCCANFRIRSGSDWNDTTSSSQARNTLETRALQGTFRDSLLVALEEV